MKRPKQLDAKKQHKRVVAELTLEKQAPKHVAEGNSRPAQRSSVAWSVR